MADTQPWFVYLLECHSGRIYTGVTPVLDRRITAHLRGKGALFTRIDKPKRLLAAKPFPSRTDALKIEKQVKKVGATQKRILADIWLQQHPIDDIAQEGLALS